MLLVDYEAKLLDSFGTEALAPVSPLFWVSGPHPNPDLPVAGFPNAANI